MPKFIRLGWVILVSLLAIAFCVRSSFYKMRSSYDLTVSERDTLTKLAITALKNSEVPVSCLIIYSGKVVAKGYNTENRDCNLGGHAEINALSDLVRQVGKKTFNGMNRDKLILITTYEPCLMCSGAIIENRIRKVFFVGEKGLAHWIKNEMKIFRYEWNKQRAEPIGLQDSLFRLSPDYHP